MKITEYSLTYTIMIFILSITEVKSTVIENITIKDRYTPPQNPPSKYKCNEIRKKVRKRK